MIDYKSAETALAELRLTDRDKANATIDARLSAQLLKYELALAIERLGNEGVPATIRKDLAYKDPNVVAALKKEAAAAGYLTLIDATRDTNQTEIGLYQSMVKDWSKERM
jgi:hypothetical protein